MPISAIIGRKDLMDQYPAGSMTSTHTGSPICVAAALASIDIIMKEKLWINAERMGKLMMKGLIGIRKKFPERVGAVQEAGERIGLRTDGLWRQEEFLVRSLADLERSSSAFAAWTPPRLRQLRTLLHPGHLGHLFRVLQQSRT